MPDNDDILKRIQQQAYEQAHGSGGGVSAPASPADLAQLCLGHRWLRPQHLELLNRELVEAAEGKLAAQGYTGLIVMAPPRHGKSTLISEYFPPWFLGRNPMWQVLLVSSEGDFAAKWGGRGRDILKQYGPRIFGVTVREDLAAADLWEIARYGGGMATAGAGGQITGRGAHCLIIEDPIKNAEQAQSALFRDKLWEWYNSTARPRLEPGGFILLVMARWHEDDLAGRLIRQMQADPSADRFKIIRLPAIAEENDPLGRKPGDPLWPERYDSAALDKIRHSVGFRIWNALYQQAPCSTEAAMFRREWFGFVDTPPPLVKAIRFWDTAATEATQDTDPDYTVGAKLGIDRSNRVTILDIRRVRGTPRQVEELIRQTAYEDGASVLVRIEQEPGSAGKAVVDHYRDILRGFDVRGVPASGNKVSRAKPLSEFAETGNLSLLYAPWNAGLLDELEAFPNGLHDDQVDACSGAFAELRVVATTLPEVATEADKLRVEPLTYDLRWQLTRAWNLSGAMLCCVWFQVEEVGHNQFRVKVLLEIHTDAEWASSFISQVLEATRKRWPAAAVRPHDIVIVPKTPVDHEMQEKMLPLWVHNAGTRIVPWEPEQFNAVFGEILQAGAISVDRGCPAIVEAIRSGCGRKRSGGVAVDSFLEPLVRTVTGGIAAVFTVARPRV